MSILRSFIVNMLLLAIVFLSLEPGCSLFYLLHAAKGQLSILLSRRSVEEVLQDGNTAEQTRRNLVLIKEMAVYARERIGLSVGSEYTTLCTRDATVYVVTAAPRLKLTPYEWFFPIVGSVPYLGFFSVRSSKRTITELERQGLDVSVRQAAAYSTLGWFADPIFPSFLSMSESQLARLIFHELTHRTIFLPGRNNFNETAATFVGIQGSLTWLAERHGTSSTVFTRAVDYGHDRRIVAVFVEAAIGQLERLYASGQSEHVLLEARERLFDDLTRDWQEIQTSMKTTAFRTMIRRDRLNNAYLLSIRNYDKNLDLMDALFHHCHDDITRTVTFLRSLEKSKEDPIATISRYIAE